MRISDWSSDVCSSDLWDERPLLIIMAKPGVTPTREELLAWYEGKIAKWWTPDDVVFVEQLPLTATGNKLKNKIYYRHTEYPGGKIGRASCRERVCQYV